METTPRWGLRTPSLEGDPPDVPLWMKRLALDLDDHAKDTQGPLSARPSASKTGRYYYATDESALYRDTGSAWAIVGAPPLVTSLPSSPTDGQEVYYLASATDGIVWHLRYRVGSLSAYKWGVVSGGPLTGRVDASEATNVTSDVVDLTTVGPSVTVPLAGDYELSYGAQVENLQGTIAWIAVYLPSPGVAVGHMSSTASRIPLHRTLPRTMSASQEARLRYRSTDAGYTVRFSNRYLSARPVRVG